MIHRLLTASVAGFRDSLSTTKGLADTLRKAGLRTAALALFALAATLACVAGLIAAAAIVVGGLVIVIVMFLRDLWILSTPKGT